jgi:hypothetical protein
VHERTSGLLVAVADPGSIAAAVARAIRRPGTAGDASARRPWAKALEEFDQRDVLAVARFGVYARLVALTSRAPGGGA